MNALETQLDTAKKSFRARLIFSALGAIILLAVAAPLAYFSHVVSFRVSPPLAADNVVVSVPEGIGQTFDGRAYILGARAALRFESPGFISQTVAVDFAQNPRHLAVEMREAPVKVVISTQPSLPQTRWRVDGVYADTAAQFAREFQPGAIRIEADNEFYRVETLSIEVQTGKDFAQHLTLTPVTGNLDIRSEPPGATVVMDGKERGVTPLEINDVPGGAHRLQIALDGYQGIEEKITITNTATEFARDYRFVLRQTEVRIKASPTGGVVRVDGVAVGDNFTAPLSLSLAAGQTHILQYEKPGYVALSQEIALAPDQRAEISFQLQEETGEVVIRSTPPADILINDAPAGVTPKTVRLQALKQKITLQKTGYRAVELTVTPSAAAPLLIDETLQSEFDARLSQAPQLLTAAAGVKMKFFDPRSTSNNPFIMGAPPGDQSRRANEFQRRVSLTKPFYVSLTEITEEQFANYKPIPAAGKNLPVSNVSWADAAGFANWMSMRDGLQPAYQFTGGRVGFDATADGYRLLSEAEWEWLARVAGRPAAARFVWGNETTIPANSGNFADESAKGGVPEYIPRYTDGFAALAPVASFTADAVGLYDMAGNVSEWMHDRYGLQPPAPGQVESNPFGAEHGDGRVIKGSNFRSASVTRLRSSFRDGSLHGRDDVGFRIARYLYGKE